MSRIPQRVFMAAVAIALAVLPSASARAGGGYYYEARSFYVAPPLLGGLYYAPIAGPVPIVVYEPVPIVPPREVGRFYPLAPTPTRIKERYSRTPHRSRYRLDYDFPGRADYTFRYKRDGALVRYRESWSD